MSIQPFTLHFPQEDLEDLRARLARTRFPEAQTAEGWIQGVPLERMRSLADYWRDEYDWRACEARLNRLDQYIIDIDGLAVHFLHIRSPEAGALPLLLTHGWPGSVLEFEKTIGPLSDPVRHGGRAQDAFHLVIPSLPGYGLSGKPTQTGWNVERIARGWTELMRRLGYDRFVAQGGDWGSIVTIQLGVQAPEELQAIHLNMLFAKPAELDDDLDEEERLALKHMEEFANVESAYSRVQWSRPQTLGYALSDSPAGQAAWIYEKFQRWSDCNGDPENAFTRDELLDNITLYWLTNSGASSARLYFESLSSFRTTNVRLPVGLSVFPKEIVPTPRKWADKVFPNIIHWNKLDRGGHFAAFEQPELFVDELRTCFASVR